MAPRRDGRGKGMGKGGKWGSKRMDGEGREGAFVQ